MIELPIIDNIPEFSSVEKLNNTLRLSPRSCGRCDLGLQPKLKGHCVYRGNTNSRLLGIGEGPGEQEDLIGRPFEGPAGKLLDKIFSCVGWDTNRDWLLTNIVFCRPIAPPGFGKKNISPKPEYIKSCNSYLQQIIKLIDPTIIVTIGRPATETILEKKIPISRVRGQVINKDGKRIFPIFHPAAILHNERFPEKQREIKQLMWADVKKLKRLIDD